MKDGKPSVLVAVLNEGVVRPELFAALSTNHPELHRVTYFPAARPSQHNRGLIVKRALQEGYDWLLMIDSDTVPLRDPLELVKMDLDVVSCPCPQIYGKEIYWVVMDKVDGGFRQVPRNRRQGLIESDAVGSACMLIKRRVLEVVKAPFAIQWNSDAEMAVGLDLSFCDKARAAGFRVWAHWDYLCSHYKTLDLCAVTEMLVEASENGRR